MPQETYIIMDFDSTFVAAEGLDLLAEIALKGRIDRKERLRRIRRTTRLGMEGIIRFEDSLARRIALLGADRGQVAQAAQELRGLVTPSFRRNGAFLRRNADRLFVVSGGFDELIMPTCSDFGIPISHVLSNSFRYDRNGVVTGIDVTNPLSMSGGKAVAVRSLELTGTVIAVGDGMTDVEIRDAGAADRFIAFTENVHREAAVRAADGTASSLDELIETHLSASCDTGCRRG